MSKNLTFSLKKVKVNQRLLFFQILLGPCPQCCKPSPKANGPKKIFKGFFYHVWAWQPSWSCDQDAANKLSFPLTIEAPYEIWL